MWKILIATVLASVSAQSQLPHLPIDQALAHLKVAVVDFDMVALREDYSTRPGFSAGAWLEQEDASKALDAKKPDKALKLANQRLADHPLEVDAWIIKGEAERAKGDAVAAERDVAVAVKILRAVETTGDGRSQTTAWTVISVAEEYALMSVKDLKPGMQALMDKDGHQFDVIDVTDNQTGATSKIWFNIDRVFAHEFEGLR